MNARLHATSPRRRRPGPCRPGPLHARLPRVRRPPRQRLAEHRRRRRRLYLRHRRQPLPRRGGRHVVHQHRPGARGNGSHRGRADPPAGLFQSFCDMANPRAIELCRKLAELAPATSTTCSSPPAVPPPWTPRSASCTTTRTAAASAPRSTSSRGSTPTTARPSSACRWVAERRPAGRVRLPRRAHPPPCLSLLLPRSGRSGRAEFLDGLVEEFERKILELGADRVGRSSPSRCSAPAA